MTIVNEGVGNCDLVYNITGNYNGSTFCEFTNTITVTPSLVGLFTSLSPAKGTVSESTNVTLTWNRITNAVYDVYLWNAVNQRPTMPVVSGTSELRYTSMDFCQNGSSGGSSGLCAGVRKRQGRGPCCAGQLPCPWG